MTMQGWPDLKATMNTAEVGNLQRFLNRWGFGTTELLVVDESFGPKTEARLRQYQNVRNLPTTGIFDSSTRLKAIREGFVPFVQAKGYNRLPGKRDIRKVVIHTMEFPEKPNAAVQVARWFAGPTAPKASAHYCLDSQDLIQCVRDNDIAWHAPGANNDGIGIEHAGYAKQTTIEWDDAYSRALLQKSIELTARLCEQYGIPPVKLEASDLQVSTIKGICGHADVSKAFGGSTHWDPGPNFPWNWFINRVKMMMP